MSTSRFPTKVTVQWSRKKRDPGQTWRFWKDRGADFTGYRFAWFYVTVER